MWASLRSGNLTPAPTLNSWGGGGVWVPTSRKFRWFNKNTSNISVDAKQNFCKWDICSIYPPTQDSSHKWRFRLGFPTKDGIILILTVTGWGADQRYMKHHENMCVLDLSRFWSIHQSYCWWFRNLANQLIGKLPILCKVLFIPGGAGFLPSTVCSKFSFIGFVLAQLSSDQNPWDTSLY